MVVFGAMLLPARFALVFAVSCLCATPAAAREPVAPAASDALRVLPFSAADALRAHRLRGFTAEIAQQIFAAEEGGEIALAASALPLPGAGAGGYVALLVEVDGVSFLRHNQAAEAWLEVYAYALTVEDSVAGHFAQAVALDVAAVGERLALGGLKLYGHLELPAGEYRLRVLVRNPQSGAAGVRSLPLLVAGSPVAVFPESESRWLAAVESAAGGAAIDAEYPFVAAGRALSPAARPVLAGGREAEAHLFGPGPVLDGALSGSVRFLASGAGEAQADSGVDFVAGGPAAPAPGGLMALPVRFRPPDLPAGEYLLRIELRRDAGETVTAVALPVWVTAGDVRERDLLWTDLRWMIDGARRAAAEAIPRAVEGAPAGSASRAPAPAERATGGRQRRRVRRAAERYRAVLASLASRPVAEAAGVLFELESDVLGRGSEQLADLRAAELRVASQLAGRDPESLVPLLAAHLELYRVYRGRRLHSLLAHSRLLTEALAETYAGAGGRGTVAAHALACLGGDLQEADLTASSQRLFGRALDHDPGHRGALLGMAISFERRSLYEQAVAVLEHLVARDPVARDPVARDPVEVHPDFAQGRLRLAINLDRLGLRRRSQQLLAGVAGGEGPPWVVALAAQQLARRHLETGDFESAERLLIKAIEDVPGEPGSRLLLAYLYDRQRRPLESLELLRGVEPQAAGDGSAARVYDRWPRSVLAEARRALLAEAERRRDRLGELVR